jgi:hypothetical protein
MLRRASTPSLPFFHSPGATSIPGSTSLASKWATVFLVRESVQTIALHSGLPVLRLHATAVSRWLVMPEKMMHQMRTDDAAAETRRLS